MRHPPFGLTVLALAVLVPLSGCGTEEDTPPSGPASTTSAAPGGQADLTTADSALGEIVVDGAGMAAYVFTDDTPGSGESTCADACLAAWPAIGPAGDEPVVDGVSADVGVITGTDGEPQLTIDGRPVYTFAGDASAGDVTGQGLDDAWYVVAPDGTEITTAPATAGTTSGY